MWLWWCLPLAWLAGVWAQLQQAALCEAWVYASTAGVAGLMLLALLALRTQGWEQGRPALAFRAAGLLLVALLAWSSTGWRAERLLSERLPVAWLGRDVQVEVQFQGLPRPVMDGVQVDAEVIAWREPTSQARRPALISVRLPSQIDGVAPRAGQRWLLAVRLHAPDGQANPAGFDATLGPFERGVRAMGRVSKQQSPRLLSLTPRKFWQGMIDRWRQDIRDRIMATVPDTRQAGVLAGLAIGDQSAIDQEDWALFRDTGIAHVVAVSGGHIMMLGWLVAGLVRAWWPRWSRGVHWVPAPVLARWMAVLVCTLYAALAGWGLPAQRTVYMLFMVALLRQRGSLWPWPMVLLVSAAFLTLLDPWGMLQAGFWLSYVAVAVLLSTGFMGSGDPLEAPVRLNGQADDAQRAQAPASGPLVSWLLQALAAAWQGFVALVRTQMQISVALAPLSLVFFQQMSVVGLAANLWAIPLFTVVVTPLSMLGVVFSPCWSLGGSVVAWSQEILQHMSQWPMATLQAPAVPWWVAVPAVLAAWAQSVPRLPWRWRMLGWPFIVALFCLPTRWWLIAPPQAGHFQMLAVDIGQGTAVLVRTAHHALLYDTGPRWGQSDAGERTLVPLLRALAVQRLDALMISHEDTDHVGGASSVMRSTTVSALLSSLVATHPLLAEKDERGKAPASSPCVAGQRWAWDGVQFEVLHPTADDYARRAAHPDKTEPNAMSCVLRVSAGRGSGLPSGGTQASVLLAGDIGVAQEAAIVQRAQEQGGGATGLRSTVLVAAHHGSDTSSSRAFLQAVAPAQVVIQAGARNGYGHPSRKVLGRLRDMNLEWQATPACGAYLWRSHGLASGTLKPQQASSSAGLCWRTVRRHYWDESAQNWLERPRGSGGRQARRDAAE